MFSLVARLRGAIAAPLPLLGLVAAVGPLAMATASSASDPVSPGESAYNSLPALPEGSAERDVDGVVETAIELASTLRAVTVDDEGTVCAEERLYVSWTTPGDGYERGAHVTPVGPAPDASTTEVNGVVLCVGGDHSYMGFEARWSDERSRWDLVAVPDISDESEEHLVAQPAPVVPAGPRPVPALTAAGTVDGPIEGYAAYEPQRTCDPSPKAGTRALAGALLRDHPGSRNLGIVRGCGVGGRSEHKEGRAFDWGVNIGNSTEKAAAEAFIGALMATDADGNQHALARRMGVMYVIWDRQIWSSYRAADGWRPYAGASAHRDHVHISLSWAGAEGRTSFWSGTVPPDLPTASAGRSTAAGGSRRSSAPTTRVARGTAAPSHHHDGDRSDGRRRRGDQASWDAGEASAPDEERWREERRARREAEEARRREAAAAWDQAREDAEAAWREEHADDDRADEGRRTDDGEHRDGRRRRRTETTEAPPTTVAPAPQAPAPTSRRRRGDRTATTTVSPTTTTIVPTTTTTVAPPWTTTTVAPTTTTTAAPTPPTTETTTVGP